jgi:hypothetical protein
MRAKVAVATVKGKAYFLIVDELKRRNIPFISLIPGQPVPVEVKAAITTEEEKHMVNHERVIVFNVEGDQEVLGSQVARALQGIENYQSVVVGVDPGDVIGVAVVADGAVVDSDNCFSIQEVVKKIKRVLKTVDASSGAVLVKVGNGVPVYLDLMEALDKELPSEVTLEVVSEAGTNHFEHKAAHGRNRRHIISATRIAGRTGHLYPRGRIVEEYH